MFCANGRGYQADTCINATLDWSARIVDLFNLKKKDNDYVDKQDLIVILKSLGFKICYEIFEDSKNCYSFEELSDYVLKFESNYYAKKKVEKCIRFLNPQSETISKSSLKTLLCEHGNKFTENEFKKFLVDLPVIPTLSNQYYKKISLNGMVIFLHSSMLTK
ncbi:hypothetical protein C922_04290 [Plasmodium inui San Antonio 1]|uniref:EF-hand domain-containing protein n=1 Tax=Plasmodium inui San Antonio 1 TaxID=1237626 RepID=W6ZX20_9APIC|nr:hypothetical protein C922_04290 [Plasmodium inui San Antonio 1]EUD65347.1 hypothetical protein C922_04290 [Plasmodium inui San Antonio 1]